MPPTHRHASSERLRSACDACRRSPTRRAAAQRRCRSAARVAFRAALAACHAAHSPQSLQGEPQGALRVPHECKLVVRSQTAVVESCRVVDRSRPCVWRELPCWGRVSVRRITHRDRGCIRRTFSFVRLLLHTCIRLPSRFTVSARTRTVMCHTRVTHCVTHALLHTPRNIKHSEYHIVLHYV